MHFLVFMYLFVMIAICFGGLLYIATAFYQDLRDKRWNWVGIYLVSGPVVTLILHHNVDLMVKFVNA